MLTKAVKASGVAVTAPAGPLLRKRRRDDGARAPAARATSTDLDDGDDGRVDRRRGRAELAQRVERADPDAEVDRAVHHRLAAVDDEAERKQRREPARAVRGRRLGHVRLSPTTPNPPPVVVAAAQFVVWLGRRWGSGCAASSSSLTNPQRIMRLGGWSFFRFVGFYAGGSLLFQSCWGLIYGHALALNPAPFARLWSALNSSATASRRATRSRPSLMPRHARNLPRPDVKQSLRRRSLPPPPLFDDIGGARHPFFARSPCFFFGEDERRWRGRGATHTRPPSRHRR